MTQEPQWLKQVLSISENTPYTSGLKTNDAQLDVKGDTIFQLGNEGLTFQFFIDDERPHPAGYAAFAASRHRNTPLTLMIPSLDFTYHARVTSGPVDDNTGTRTSIKGFVDSASFGPASEKLDK